MPEATIPHVHRSEPRKTKTINPIHQIEKTTNSPECAEAVAVRELIAYRIAECVEFARNAVVTELLRREHFEKSSRNLRALLGVDLLAVPGQSRDDASDGFDVGRRTDPIEPPFPNLKEQVRQGA